jgi:hypothetical protein
MWLISALKADSLMPSVLAVPEGRSALKVVEEDARRSS